MGDFYPTNPGYDKVDEVVLGKKPPMRYFIAYSLALVGSVLILLSTILRFRQDFSLESLLRLLGHSLCLLFFLHGFWETFPRKKPVGTLPRNHGSSNLLVVLGKERPTEYNTFD